MRYLQMLLIALSMVALSTLGLAQTASISGTVTDSSGALVQGAEVTVLNLATGESHAARSAGNGVYAITNLTVGNYEVTAKQQAFRTFHVASVTLTVAQSATVNVQLQPGGASEEVTVRGDQLPDVELQDTQISNLVDQRQMESLPLITRNPYQLVLLSPGTSQTDSSSGGFSVNGARDRNNNFLLDGVDNNDTSVPGGPGGVLNANPDSTQEFRVITDNFNAEYGRNTGAIIDVVTKSGTNSLHGGVYYFGRWNGFGGARDWFNPGTGPNAGPMNPYIRHQFGFSVGGPIIKNKTFFFFNDEMDRFRTTLTNNSTVPTAAFLTGKINYTYTDTSGVQQTVPIDLTPGGANNATGIGFDPTMLAVFAKYPTASQTADGISGNVFFPSTAAQSTYNPTIKIDHHINDRESLSLRYAYNHFFDPNGFHTDFLPGNIGAIASKSINEGLSAQLTSTLSNTLVNNFQFGWNHVYATFFLGKATTSFLNGPGGVDSFGNGSDYLLDPFSNFASPLGGSDSQNRKTGTVSYTDNLTRIRGNHTLKFGFDFRNIRESGFNNFTSRRQLTLSPLLTFGVDPGLINPPKNDPGTTLVDAAAALYGFVAEDNQSQFFNKSGVRQTTDNKVFRQHEYDWYGQDTWKVRRNVTLNLGLRYQLNSVPYEETANFSNLLQDPSSFATGAPVVFTVVGPGTGHSIYNPDYKDIEPRVGLTWDPWSDGKTAVRAGFGIFHDRVFGNEFGNARANPPFQAQYTQFPFDTIHNALGSGNVPAQIPTQTPSASIPDNSAVAEVVFNTHFPNTASNNWNLDVQRELGANNVVDIAYVGAMGVHVLGQRDGNPPDPALVQQLLAFCVPGNPNNQGFTGLISKTNPLGQCNQGTVSGISLYIGATPSQGINDLPFNAVNNNALVQPFYQIAEFNSIYHGLQTKFTHRMSHGLQIQGAYTWSHALDNSVDPLTPAVGARTFPRNSRNLAQSYGNSDNDTRHVAVINYIWEMPFGRGKGYLNHGVAGRLLEGMQFSGILTVQSGHPFNVRGTKDTQRTGINAWAYQVGDPYGPPSGPGCAPTPGSGFIYITNRCAFVNPPLGSASNNERNNFYGPGFWDWDMSFSKRMSLTERVNAELRFEGYNVFNHPHFLNPGTDTAGLGNLIGQSAFGVITNTFVQPDGTTSARQLQVALRINF